MKRAVLALLGVMATGLHGTPAGAQGAKTTKVELRFESNFGVKATFDAKQSVECEGPQAKISIKSGKLEIVASPRANGHENDFVLDMLDDSAEIRCKVDGADWLPLEVNRALMNITGAVSPPDGLLSPALTWHGMTTYWKGRPPKHVEHVACEVTQPEPPKDKVGPACTATYDRAGVLRVRTMDTQVPVKQVTLYYGTGKSATRAERQKLAQLKLNVVECKYNVRGLGASTAVVAGASQQLVALEAQESLCPPAATSLEVEGQTIPLESLASGRVLMRNVPRGMKTGSLTGKAVFDGSPIGDVKLDVVPPLVGNGAAFVAYQIDPKHDPHGLFAAASGAAARVDANNTSSLAFAVVDPAVPAVDAVDRPVGSIVNSVEVSGGALAAVRDGGVHLRTPATPADCSGESRVRYAWVIASTSWGDDFEPLSCVERDSHGNNCVLADGLSKLSYQVKAAHPEPLRATVQLIEQTFSLAPEPPGTDPGAASVAATTTSGTDSDTSSGKRGDSKAPSAKSGEPKAGAAPSGTVAAAPPPTGTATAAASGTPTAVPTSPPAAAQKRKCVANHETLIETTIDLAAAARRESVPLPIRTAVVVECQGAFEIKKEKEFTRWVGDGDMRSIEENDVRNGLCTLRMRPFCDAGETPEEHGCRPRSPADALFGPQVVVLKVSRGASEEALAVYSLPAPDTEESGRARLVLPKPTDTGMSEGVYFVEAQVRAQPRADVTYRAAFKDKLANADLTAENRDLRMVAQLRPRGVFGWSWRPLGESFRSFVTLPVQVTGARFPASPRDMKTSRDPLAYQLLTPKVGVLAVVEPWNYDAGENPTALNVGLATGFQFFQIAEGTVSTSYLLGLQATLPLIHANNVPSSTFSSQIGTSLTLGLFWELDLRDGISRGNHFMMSLGLNVLSLFSGK